MNGKIFFVFVVFGVVLLMNNAHAEYITLRPNTTIKAADTQVGCTSSTQWDCLDEVAHDSDTSAVAVTTDILTNFDFNDTKDYISGGIPNGARIDWVLATGVMRDGTGNAGNNNGFLRLNVSSGSARSIYNSSDLNPGASWEELNHTTNYTTNPKSGVAWTEADLNGLMLDFDGTGDVIPPPNATQLSIKVGFTPVLTANASFGSNGVVKVQLNATQSTILNGTCNVNGGTASSLQLYIQDNSSGSWANSSTGSGNPIYANISGYSLGAVGGTSGNMYFNVTVDLNYAEYGVRIQCSDANAVPSWANSTAETNITAFGLATTGLNATNGAANYSINHVNSTTIDYNIVLTNSSRAFVVKTESVNASGWYSINILNNTIVRVARGAWTQVDVSPSNLSWQVVEFDSGIRVQRGNITMDNATAITSTFVNLTDRVVMTKSFLLVYASGNWSATSQAGSLVSGNLTNSTQLNFSRLQGDSGSVNIEWQLVEFLDNTTVQAGVTSIAGSSEKNVTINDVNLSKAFVIVNYQSILSGSTPSPVLSFYRANLTNTTNLRFNVNTTSGLGSSSPVSYYVVNLSHENATSQQIDVNLPVNARAVDINITSVNVSRSVIFGAVICDEKSSATGRCLMAANFTNSTQVRFFRRSQDLRTAAQGTYYIVQFPSQGPYMSANASFGSTGATATINVSQSIVFNGTCTSVGGTSNGVTMGLQDNSSGTFQNTDISGGQLPPSPSIYTNTTYNINDVSGTSGTMFFNVTVDYPTANYGLRVQCSATNKNEATANSVVETNLTVAVKYANAALNATNGAANYSVIHANGTTIDYPVVLTNFSRAFVVKTEVVNATGFYSINILNNTIVRAQRGQFDATQSNVSASNLSWQVVEFDSGMRVLRGNVTMNNATTITVTTANLTDSVDLRRSFPIIYTNGNWTSSIDASFVRSNFTNSTQLAFTRNSAVKGSVNIEWQVVEFLDNTTVTSGTIVIGSPVPIPDQNVTINAINLSKAFVLFSYTPPNDGGSSMQRANLTNSTNLEFTNNRTASGGWTIKYFVVNLGHENATSQQIDVVLPVNAIAVDINITSVNVTSSVIFGSVLCEATAVETGRCLMSANFTNSTQVRFFRQSQDLRVAARGTYYIVQFPSQGPYLSSNASFGSTGATATLSIGQSIVFNGTCTAVSGTANSVRLFLQDNSSGSFANTSTSPSPIYANISGYNISDLSGTSGNLFFNVTVDEPSANYGVRIQCAASNANVAAANSVVKTNITVSAKFANAAINATNGAANYSIINSNGVAIDYPVVLINSSKAFVVKTDAVNSSSFYSINIFNNTVVRAQRRSVPATSQDNFSWFLVEFDSGVRVQRGNLTLADSYVVASTANLTDSVDLRKSFPIVYSTVNSTPARIASSLLYVNFTNSTQLYFYKNSSLSSTETEWQVVEFFDNTTVQSSSFTMNTSLKDQNITINDVNLSKAFVVFYYASNLSNVPANVYLRANLTNTTNLEFTKNSSGDKISALNVSYYVVNLSHENATSQQIDVNLPVNAQAVDINITSVNVSRSVIIGSFICNSPSTGTDGCFITANFTNSTQVRFFRRSNDLRTPAQGTYYIVQFPFTANTVAAADTCTPTAGQDWNIKSGDNCTITGQNYNVKYMYITGSTGKFTVRNSNISSTGCSTMPNPGSTVQISIEATSRWANGCV